MEPVGLAVGIAGLAGLFSSCLEAVEKVQSYRSFGADSQVLDTQFKAEKLRFEQWGWHPAFLHWLSPDFPAGTAKLLWINGPAGFGKTILCARVVEHLSSTLETPVAHFFFSSDFESRGDPFAAIRSWISQVMSRDQGAFDLVRGRWEAQQEQIATRADVVKLFRELVRAVPGCTLVLDGLDECTSMSENRMVAGSESVERCLETVKQAVADTTTRVMLVSRDEPDIRHALMDNTGEEFAEYKISPEDVRADTASYSRSIVDRKLYNKNEAVKGDISRRMADRCEGQFLWLKMQEDCLSRGKNQKQLEAAIDETPTGLERVYDRNWEKIAGHRERKRAVSLLRWAAFALRPLTICEITEAVLIDDDCDDLPIDELPDAIDEDYIDSEIMDLCGSLLEVRSTPSEPSAGLRTVHLTHFSVKQYLLCNIPAQGKRLLANESLRASNEAIESTVLAKLCLRYINFPRVWHGTLQEKMDPLEKSFRDYAAGSRMSCLIAPTPTGIRGGNGSTRMMKN
ncbi:ankyrin-1 [Dactylonectria estremocensis]|uniref:Ankyrin-1 n=1 Tax=Dactylonectria estremocensis TaxID=1079267 RepID=A0A9P9F003_9HYPO|nr:ankyrin-1 [Dactylonectria estremocensis]